MAEQLENRLLLATFTVTTNADSGTGSLRDAILLSNKTAGRDTIDFNIVKGTQIIAVASALPDITDSVILGDAAHSGAPVVTIDGLAAGKVNGLTITAGSSYVTGLAIVSFASYGLVLGGGGNQVQGNFIGVTAGGTAAGNGGGVFINSGNNLIGGDKSPNLFNVVSSNYLDGIVLSGAAATGNIIDGNLIGTDAAGKVDMGNGRHGLNLSGAPGNTIGGALAAMRNIISGNAVDGIFLSAASNNLIQGNYIGLNAAGTSALGNTGNGIVLTNDSNNNTITGSTSGVRNVIAANADGVELLAGSTGNAVQGNYIGLTSAGAGGPGNSGNGILISDAPGNIIGGSTAGTINLIGGNGADGIRISGSKSTGNTVAGNIIGLSLTSIALGNAGNGIVVSDGASSNTIGATTTLGRNVIVANTGAGVTLSKAQNNLVQGNYIGTTANGLAAMGNTGGGVLVDMAAGNTIGGTATGAGNIISDNGFAGVSISGTGASGNSVLGNLIGTNGTGTARVGSFRQQFGVYLNSGPNTIGGTAAGSRNIITGNVVGVEVDTLGGGSSVANPTAILGNYIGTDIAGTTGLTNSGNGVVINGASQVLIGGTQAGAGNVISANNDGINISGSTTGISIQGNLIGTDSTGNSALGNRFSGVAMFAASGVTIGGTSAASRNIISGNLNDGIYFSGNVAANVVQGNYIGVAAKDGSSPLGNGRHGVLLVGPNSNVLVGGTTTGAGNIIATNASAGVFIDAGTGNAVLGNSMFANGRLGIDLKPDGVTPNDSGDADGGANNLQNFPVINSTKILIASTIVQGTLDSVGGNYRIEVFSNTATDPTGYGEGKTLLASTVVGIPVGGPSNFNVTLPIALLPGQILTATATDAANSTSEFSAAYVVPPPALTIGDASVTEGDSGTVNANFTVNLGYASGQTITVQYATADNTAQSTPPADFIAVPPTTLTFTPGQTSRTVTVQVLGDTLNEGNETFFVNLTSPSNASTAHAQGVGTIIDDDQTFALGQQLDTGLSSLFTSTLARWGSAFNLPNFNLPARGLPAFHLPVVTDLLDSLLGISTKLGQLTFPQIQASNNLSALITALQNAGVTVQSVSGGLGNIPASTGGDQLRATYSTSLSNLLPLLSDAFNNSTPGLLSGVTAVPGLKAALNLAGNLQVTITFGVDGTGFFIGGDSNLSLHVSGSGNVTGSANIGGKAGVSISGTGNADLNVALLAGATSAVRLRSGDLSATPTAYLTPTAAGSASLALGFTVGPFAATWQGNLSASVAADHSVAVSLTTSSLSGTLQIPGLQSSTGGAFAPASIAMVGTFASNVWTLSASLPIGASYRLLNFGIDQLSFSATIGATRFDANGSGRVSVKVGDLGLNAAVMLAFNFSGPNPGGDGFHADTLSMSGLLELDNQLIGSSPAIAWVDKLILSAHFDANFAANALTGGIGASAGTLVLLPSAAPAGQVPTGLTTITGLAGSLASDGSLSISINGNIQATVASRLAISATAFSLTLSPNQTDTAVVATLGSATVQLSFMPDLPPFSVNQVTIDRRGNVSIGAASVGDQNTKITLHQNPDDSSSPVTLQLSGVVATLTGIRFSLDPTSGQASFGLSTVGLAAGSALVFPSSDHPGGLASAQGLSATIDLANRAVTLTAQQIAASIAGILQINTVSNGNQPAATFNYDPRPEAANTPLLLLGSVTASLGSPTRTLASITLTGFGVTRTGGLLLTSAGATLPPGNFSLGGFLPVQIRSLNVTFGQKPDGTIDPTNVSLGGSATFDPTLFSVPSSLPVAVQIGDPPASLQSLPFSLNVGALANGQLRVTDFGPVTVTVPGLTIAGTTFDAQLAVGRFDSNGAQQSAPGSTHPVAGFVTVQSSSAGFPIGTRVDLAGDLTLNGNSATLHIEGTGNVTLGDSTTAASGSVSVNFGLTVAAVSKPNSLALDSITITPSLSSAALRDVVVQLPSAANPVVKLTVHEVKINLQHAADQPAVEFHRIDIAFPALPQFHGSLDLANVFLDAADNTGSQSGRMDISGATISLDGASIAAGSTTLLNFTDLKATLNLSVDLTLGADGTYGNFQLHSGGPVENSIGISAASASVLPDQNLNATATGISGLLSLVNDASTGIGVGGLSLDVQKFTASLDGVIDVTATGDTNGPAVAIHYGASANGAPALPLLQFAQIKGVIDALSGTDGQSNPKPLIVDLNGLGFTQSGDVLLTSATLELPDYSNSFYGLGGVLPAKLQTLTIQFPQTAGKVDLNQFTLSGTATLDFSHYDLPFSVQVSAISFTVKVDSLKEGLFSVLNVSPITVHVDATVLGAQVTGDLKFGAIDGQGVMQNVAGQTSPIAGTLTIVQGSTTVNVATNGAVAFSDRTFVLTLQTTAQLNTDGSIFTGSARADFHMTLSATLAADSPQIQSITFDPVLSSLSLQNIVIQLPSSADPVVILSADHANLRTSPAAGDPIADIYGMHAEFPRFPNWHGSIEHISLFQDSPTAGHIDLAGASLTVDNGAIGGGNSLGAVILSFNGLKVTLNLSVDFAINGDGSYANFGLRPSANNGIALNLASATLFPEQSAGFSAGVSNVTGSMDLNSGALALHVGTFSLDVGTTAANPVVEVTASNLQFNFATDLFSGSGDPALATPFLTGGTAKLVLPQLHDSADQPLGLDLSSFALSRTGFTIGSVSNTPSTWRFQGILDLINLHVTVTNLGYSLATGGFSAGSLTLQAEQATLFPDLQSGGLATATGISAVLTGRSLAVSVNHIQGRIASLIQFSIDHPAFYFDDDAAHPLFSATTVAASIPELGDVGVTLSNVQITRAGDFVLDSATLATNHLSERLGIADVLPIDISAIQLDFQRNAQGHLDLSTLDVTLTGKFNFSLLSGLPFTPILRIGQANSSSVVQLDAAHNSNFQFTISIVDGQIVPRDIGPITVGFSDLKIGPVTLGGTLTLGGYQDGQFSHVFGLTASLGGDLESIDGQASVNLIGRFDPPVAGQPLAKLSFDGSFDVSFGLGGTPNDHMIYVKNATLAFSLGLNIGVNFADPAFQISLDHLQLQGAGIESVEVHFSSLLTMKATDVHINFNPGPGEPIMTFGGEAGTRVGALTLVFGDSNHPDDTSNPLHGLGGSVGNFGVGFDTQNHLPTFYQLPDFFVKVLFPPGFKFGLPDWMPVEVREVGIVFHKTLAQVAGGALDGSTQIADLADFSLIFSGGLQGSSDGWPITAQVEGLQVSLPKLAQCTVSIARQAEAATALARNHPEQVFTQAELDTLAQTPNPIENLGAVDFGIQPFDLGPITIGGGLGLGMLSVDADPGPGVHMVNAFYGHVLGELAYDDMGVGVELILTQYGPVLGRLFAGVPVPIGAIVGALAGVAFFGVGAGAGAAVGAQTGLIITGFQGGIVFRKDPLPYITDPMQILDNPAVHNALNVSLGEVKASVEAAVQEKTFTWTRGFGVVIKGTLTDTYVSGMIGGTVTLGVNVGYHLGEVPGAPPIASSLLGANGQASFGFQLYGIGDIDILGIHLASLGLMFNFSDPLNPLIQAAFGLPGSSGSALSILLPVRGTFGATLDTNGLSAGAVLAMKAFIDKVAAGITSPSGGLAVGQALFVQVVDLIAAELESDHSTAMAQILLDTDASNTISAAENAQVITRAFLITRAQAILSPVAASSAAGAATAVNFAGGLLADLFRIASRELTLAGLAQTLQSGHNLAAAKLLLDLNGNGTLSAAENATTITRNFIVDRLLGTNNLPALGATAILALRDTLRANNQTVPAALDGLISLAPDIIAHPGKYHDLATPFDASALSSITNNPFFTHLTQLAASHGLPSPGAAGQVLAAFTSIVAGALRSAGAAFLNAINPSLTINGKLQPTVFGIPFGKAEQSVDLTINKSGLLFDFNTTLGALIDPRLAIAEALGGPSVPIGLTVSLPLGNALQSILLDGQPMAALSQFDTRWSVVLRGGFTILHFPVVQITGLIVPPNADPNSATSVLHNKIQKLYENPSAPLDPSRIPVNTQAHFDALQHYGGLILYGSLQIPHLLVDPRDVLAGINNLPQPNGPLGYPAYVSAIAGRLTAIDNPGQIQLFIPALSGAVGAAKRTIQAHAYLEGAYKGKILGLDVGTGLIEANKTRVIVSATSRLLGIDFKFGLAYRNVDIGTPGQPDIVQFPYASATASVDSTHLAAALTKLGVPKSQLRAAGSANATASVYTPGFSSNPNEPVLIKRTGGLQLNAHLAIPGIVDDATFAMAITPGVAGAPPDFTATAQVAALKSLAGIAIKQAAVTVTRAGGQLNIAIDGQATLLGASVRVHGTLASNGTGQLAIDQPGSAMQINGFGLSGGLVLVVSRVHGALQASIHVAGQVTFPAWLSNATGQLAADATGDFTIAPAGPQGRFALQFSADSSVNLNGWRISSAVATFRFSKAKASLSIAGNVDIPGLATGLHVSGSLNSNGAGSIALSGANGDAARFTLGGANSQLVLSGSFALARDASGVFVFKGSNASLAYAGFTPFTVDNFSISSTGVFDASLHGATLVLAQHTQGRRNLPVVDSTLSIGSASLHAGVGGDFHLQLHGLSLNVSGFNPLAIDDVDINPSGDFSRSLTADQLRLGQFAIHGTLTFSRQNGVFQLAVTNAPTLTLPGLASLALNEFVISSNGTFLVSATPGMIGSSDLGLSGSSFEFKRTDTTLASTSLHITGGILTVSPAAPVNTPDIDIRSDLTFSQTFDLPALNFGSAFQTGTVGVKLALGGGVLNLSLTHSVSLTTLAGSTTTLDHLQASSSGTFDAKVSGTLQIGSYQLASTTYAVTRQNGVLTAGIDSSHAVNVNLGFLTTGFSGSFSSDGTYSFTGSSSVSGSLPDVDPGHGLPKYPGPKADGTGSFTINQNGFSGTFSGQVTVWTSPVSSVAHDFSGEIDSSGKLVFGDATISLG